MRHRKKKTLLSKKRDPRRALIKNLMESIILYEKITTTHTKALAVRAPLERLITKAKQSNLSTRRTLISALQTPNVVNKLLEVIGPRYKDRNGGYTRIIKVGRREGDAAQMAVIELV